MFMNKGPLPNVFLPVLGAMLFALGTASCGRQFQVSGSTVADSFARSGASGSPSQGGDSDLGLGTAAGERAFRKRGGSTRDGQGKSAWVLVRPGDTLWNIAARRDVYGSGWIYPLLYYANQSRIPDPNHLTSGLRLKIPRNVPDVQVEKAEEVAMTGQILDTSPLPNGVEAAAASPKKPGPDAGRPGPAQSAGVIFVVVLLGVLGVALFFPLKSDAS